MFHHFSPELSECQIIIIDYQMIAVAIEVRLCLAEQVIKSIIKTKSNTKLFHEKNMIETKYTDEVSTQFCLVLPFNVGTI